MMLDPNDPALSRALEAAECVQDDMKCRTRRPFSLFSQGLRDLTLGTSHVMRHISARPDFFDGEAGQLPHRQHNQRDRHSDGEMGLEDLEYMRLTAMALRSRIVHMGSYPNATYYSRDERGKIYWNDPMAELWRRFPQEMACVERLAELISDYAPVLMKPAPNKAVSDYFVEGRLWQLREQARESKRGDGPQSALS